MRTKIFALTLTALPFLPATAGVPQGKSQDQQPPVEAVDPVQAEQEPSQEASSEPVQAEPVNTEQVAPEHVHTEQVDSEPASTEQIDPEHEHTGHIVSEQAVSEPVSSDQVDSEQASTELAQTDPVQPTVEETPEVVEARSLLHLVPEDAMLFCAVHDLDGVRSSADGNAWFRFFADEQVRPIIDYAIEAISADMNPAAGGDELPFDVLQAIRSIHGSIQIFFAPAGESLEPALGLVIDPGQDREAFDESFRAGLELIDGRIIGSIDDHDGVELAVFVDDAAQSELNTLVVFEADGVVAFVSSVGREEALEVAHGMIDRLQGEYPAPGMANRTELLEARASVGDLQDFELFVDLQDFSELTGLAEGMDEQGEKLFSTLGFDDMRWVFASASVGAGEALDFSLMAHVPESGLLHDIVGLMGPAPLDFAGRMPVHSVAVGIGGFDVWGLYGVIMDLMEQHAPEQFAMIQAQGEGFTQMTGLDYEQDLLAQFTGEFGSFSIKVPEEEALAPLGSMMVGGFDASNPDLHMGSATIVGLRDPATVEAFLDEILAMSPMPDAITVEDFHGHSINSFSAPGTGFELMWSFMNDAVVISPFPTALRAVLRVSEQEDMRSALKNKRFARALKGADQAPMVSVTDTRTQVRGMLGAFEILQSMFGGVMFGANDWEPEVEEGSFETEMTAIPPLPPASVADEYFHGTLLFSIEKRSNSVGLRFSAK